MRNLVVFLLLLGFLTGCSEPNHRKKSHKKTIKVEFVKFVDEDTDAITYWYLINNTNGQAGYYTYQSPTPVTNFSTVAWSRSVTVPAAVKTELEENPESLEVEVEDLSVDMQTEIDTTPEDFDGLTAEEMGDYEGGGVFSTPLDDDDETTSDTEEAESDTDASSESDASSDSGFDSGSDSGGGDGGGGGE